MLRTLIIRRAYWHKPPYATLWALGICTRSWANAWQFLEVCRWVRHCKMNYYGAIITIANYAWNCYWSIGLVILLKTSKPNCANRFLKYRLPTVILWEILSRWAELCCVESFLSRMKLASDFVYVIIHKYAHINRRGYSYWTFHFATQFLTSKCSCSKQLYLELYICCHVRLLLGYEIFQNPTRKACPLAWISRKLLKYHLFILIPHLVNI
jgi:hypothetical protein